MKREAQHLPRKIDLGGGVLNWERHVQGLWAHRLLKYRDASKGQWKEILDNWFDREHLGRGAIFAEHRISDLIQSTHSSCAGESKLPKVWKLSLVALKSLKLLPADPTAWPTDVARAMPIWFSPLFRPPALKLAEFWRTALRTNTVKDLIKDDGTDYLDARG